MSENPPKKFTTLLDEDTQERMRIMDEAAAAAGAENRALGISDSCTKDGKLTFKYADGRETTEWPVEILGKDPRMK